MSNTIQTQHRKRTKILSTVEDAIPSVEIAAHTDGTDNDSTDNDSTIDVSASMEDVEREEALKIATSIAQCAIALGDTDTVDGKRLKAEVAWILREEARGAAFGPQDGARLVAQWIYRNASDRDNANNRHAAAFAVLEEFRRLRKDSTGRNRAALALRVYRASGDASLADRQASKAAEATAKIKALNDSIAGDRKVEAAQVKAMVHPLIARLDSAMRSADRKIADRGEGHRDALAAVGRVRHVFNAVMAEKMDWNALEQAIVEEAECYLYDPN